MISLAHRVTTPMPPVPGHPCRSVGEFVEVRQGLGGQLGMQCALGQRELLCRPGADDRGDHLRSKQQPRQRDAGRLLPHLGAEGLVPFWPTYPDARLGRPVIRLASRKTRDWALDGHPLALLPAGFAGPKVHTLTESPTGRALWYPLRAYGRIWDGSGAAESSPALAALLGPTRAAVLTLLDVPHSTGEVAAALKLAPATASHHLTTLRDAGLVVGERFGRQLRYLRTTLGEQLGAGQRPSESA